MRWALLLGLVGSALLLVGCRTSDPVHVGVDAPANGPNPIRDHDRSAAGVFVHLFEWRWTDIASECETVLGPKGFAAVQVSPPNEHALIRVVEQPAPEPSVAYPWWQRYQPVGYGIEKSRSGTGDEFRDMVKRCAAAGVDVYVDAVINHMSAQTAGTGSNGARYTKYVYPGLFEYADFHQPVCRIADADYVNSAANVQRCELFGLSDWNTESDSVQKKIADYLIALVGVGVAGFRVDAAKHIAPRDLQAIVSRVNAAAAPSAPYWFFEVTGGAGEAIHKEDYFEIVPGGDVTEFAYSQVGDAFLNTAGTKLAGLKDLAHSGAGLIPSAKAVSFTNNHDTERGRGLHYGDAPYYELATVFLLAVPYGYPSVMSSYAFDRSKRSGIDSGPPSDAEGNTLPLRCAADPDRAEIGTWVCQHRARSAANMVAFRRTTAGEALSFWWDDGGNRIAFGRGSKGFVVINRTAEAFRGELQTGLPPGRYCDVVNADYEAGNCGGPEATVDASGKIRLELKAYGASAFYAGAKP